MTDAEFHSRNCARKKNRYATKREARQHARRIATLEGGPVMREYVCPACGFYHHTSNKQEQRNFNAVGSILEARRQAERI